MSTPFLGNQPVLDRAAWPERIAHLATVWKSSESVAERERALSELWTLAGAALVRYARLHARPCEGLSGDDLFEIASAKGVDLLRKLEAGTWDPSVSTPGQICAFLSTMARNGVVDHLRTTPRRVFVPLERADADSPPPGRPSRDAESPLAAAERGQFTRALCTCLSKLTPRARRVWLFRACLELSSREIARHPEVRMSVGAVAVALARCRIRLRACLLGKGFEPGDMPPG